jgi:hypothetical protein
MDTFGTDFIIVSLGIVILVLLSYILVKLDDLQNELTNIALTITYDNAVQVDAAGALSGLGASVGRTVRSLALGG